MRSRGSRSTVAVLAAAYLASACGDPGGAKRPSSSPKRTDGPRAACVARTEDASDPVAEAGFLEVPPGPTGPAYVNRMFYSFQPATSGAANAPVLVLFNGGPGYATSAGLLVLGTGPYTLDVASGTAELMENPATFTRFANLLYLDAPLTGFSYGLIGGTRCECRDTAADYVWDAADFVKALLAFLDSHAALRDNAVVIVGESYGGVRAPAMLHLLQYYAEQFDPIEDFQLEADAVRDRIREHFELAFPERCRPETPDEVAGQFGWQALIQPHVFGQRQSDLTDRLIVDDANFHEYARCHVPPTSGPPAPSEARVIDGPPPPAPPTTLPEDCSTREQFDDGDIRLTAQESIARSDLSAMAVTDPAALSRLLTVPIDQVRNLSGAERSDAFRSCCDGASPAADGPEDGVLATRLGPHSGCDGYWERSRQPCGASVDLYGAGVGSGRALFDALLRTNTFITHARYDALAYSGALRVLLGDTVTYGTVPWQVALDEATPDRAERPGVIRIEGEDVDTVIRFPTYEAGHEVTATQGAAFGYDLEAWLVETGAIETKKRR